MSKLAKLIKNAIHQEPSIVPGVVIKKNVGNNYQIQCWGNPFPFPAVPATCDGTFAEGETLTIGLLGKRKKPVILNQRPGPKSINSQGLISGTLAASSWYQFHKDRTCSENIPFTFIDMATIANENTYWTAEA